MTLTPVFPRMSLSWLVLALRLAYTALWGLGTNASNWQNRTHSLLLSSARGSLGVGRSMMLWSFKKAAFVGRRYQNMIISPSMRINTTWKHFSTIVHAAHILSFPGTLSSFTITLCLVLEQCLMQLFNHCPTIYPWMTSKSFLDGGKVNADLSPCLGCSYSCCLLMF